MFPIRMRKLHNISVQQTYRWKVRFVAFWLFKINVGVYEKLAKCNDSSTQTSAYALRSNVAGVTCVFMIMNERHGALTHPARLYACWLYRPPPLKLLWADLLVNGYKNVNTRMCKIVFHCLLNVTYITQ